MHFNHNNQNTPFNFSSENKNKWIPNPKIKLIYYENNWNLIKISDKYKFTKTVTFC